MKEHRYVLLTCPQLLCIVNIYVYANGCYLPMFLYVAVVNVQCVTYLFFICVCLCIDLCV